MNIKKLMAAIAVLLVFVLSFSACAKAPETAAQFYQGKTIKLRTSGSPGGGYDRWCRMMAPYLEKYTGCTVVVENLPGAGDLLSPNTTFSGTPDGLSMDMVNGVVAGIAEVTENPGMKFKMAEFVYLGRITMDPFFILASAKSPFQSIDDVTKKATRERPFKVGTEAVGDSPSAPACVVGYALGWNLKVVAGYPGTAEVQLAAIKGEVDGMGCSTTSAVSFTAEGDMKALCVMDTKRDPMMPDTPTIYEAVTIPKDKEWIITGYMAITKGGRMVVTTPGVPKERAAFLSDALNKVLTDTAFLAELATKKGMVVNYLAPKEAAELYTKMLKEAVSGENKKIFTDVLTKQFIY
jgi:tripartite-type tricarboxylate transporter receptor subunit TctC